MSFFFECVFLKHSLFSSFQGGVIAYCSSSSAPSPESCMSDSSNSRSPSSSPALAIKPSRLTDLPTAGLLSKHPRGHASDKSLAAKSSITSEWTLKTRFQMGRICPLGMTNSYMTFQSLTGWCCFVKCVETSPRASTTVFMPVKAAR